MERNQVKQTVVREGGSQWISDFGLLVKFKLNLTVVFSAVISYAIVSAGNVTWYATLLLAFGGFMVTSAANALNQVLEREYDILMPRTANRPVAAGRMSVSTAVMLAGLMALMGITVLTMFNPLTGFLGTLSLISYAFVYTPLKRSTPLAVLVGAIPGALPLIIGCVAYEGFISPMAMMLFSLQFLWQFPHFWAVAWLADDDYRKAGFYLLPTGDKPKDQTTGLLSIIFCLLLIVNALIGFALGFVGIWALFALTVLNLFWAVKCWGLFKTCTKEAARAQMFFSFAHLPLSLIVLLIDKL
ncbi:MAG: protoheme IX farnesyltransferase [Bacteroidota bacterium]